MTVSTVLTVVLNSRSEPCLSYTRFPRSTYLSWLTSFVVNRGGMRLHVNSAFKDGIGTGGTQCHVRVARPV